MSNVISLALGEPGETTARYIIDAANQSLLAGNTHYTDVLGIEDFRLAAARYTREVKGLDYSPQTELQCVPGATIGIFYALRALINTGDEVIVPSPCFTSYSAQIKLCGGIPVEVPLRTELGMHLSADDIERAVTSRTKAIIVNSPCNPTGAVTTLEELRQVAGVCMAHNLWAISDEVYHAFVFSEGIPARGGVDAVAPSIASVQGMRDRTVIIESCSKTYAMTGLRVGYIMAESRVIAETSKIAELIQSSVNSSAQYAAAAALDGSRAAVNDMRRSYQRHRDEALQILRGCDALDVIEPEGAFYIFADIRATGMSSEAFAQRLLQERHVGVVPGTAFGAAGEGYVRVSYAGNVDEVCEGARRLRDFVDEMTCARV